LKPEDLKAKSERIRDEAKALAATISTAALEETTRAILDVALRKKLVEDISKITENLARRAYKKEEEIRDYASLNEGKEVWVRFFPRAAEGADYDAVLLLAKIAQHTAADLDKRSPSVHVRYDSFVTLIEDLKQEILEGKHDDKLRIKPARAIYDLLRSRLTAEDSGR
jgi:hypothetical protein